MRLTEIITKKLDQINEKYSEINLIKLNNDPENLNGDIEIVSNFIDELSKDLENIVNIPIEKLEVLLNKYSILSFDCDVISMLDDIKFLLKGKLEMGLPIDLSENQSVFLKTLLSKLVLLLNVLNDRVTEYNKVVSEDQNLEIDIISYEDLLEKIQDPDNIEPIYQDEYNLIERIILDPKFKFSKKRDLLLSVMEYNSQVSKNHKKTPKLNVEELIDLLQIDYKLGDSYIKHIKKYRNDVALYGNMENIKEILEFLKSKNILFKFPEVELIAILIFATKSSVMSTYKYLEDNNMLDNAFFYNASVWKYNHDKKLGTRPKKSGNPGGNKTGSLRELANKISLDEVILSYNFLISKGYNIDLNDEKSIDVLSEGLKRLQYNYSQYVLYGIIDDSEKDKDKHSILTFSNIMDKLDLLIELGLYDYTKKYPSAVQSLKAGSIATLFDLKNRLSDKEYAERIFVEKTGHLKGSVGIKNPQNNLSDEDIHKYLLDSGLYEFQLPEMKEINEYLFKNNPMIINPSIFNEPNIINLEQNYKQDEYTYNFNGQLISRLKVLRNYSALLEANKFEKDNIFICSILNNSMVTEDRFMDIVNSVGYKLPNGRN